MKYKLINSVQSSLITLLAIIFAIASISIAVTFGIEKSRLKQLALEEKLNMSQTFESILRLNNDRLSDLIFYEYAQWDETVKYIQNPNEEYTQINIDWLIENYKFDGVWLINNKNELVYKITNQNIKALPFDQAELPQILDKSKELFFYSGTKKQIIEIYASTINTSSDNSKSGESFGYFIAARTWSQRVITSFENLTNSKICYYTQSNNTSPNLQVKEGIINFSKQFLDYKNRPFAKINITTKSNLTVEFWKSSVILLAVIAICGFTVLVIFGFATKIIISKPLSKIISSLDNNHIENVEKLKSRQDEFGKIALLINKFFRQKKELNKLIEQKNFAEEEERKRISRELHDSIGQILMSTKLRLNSIKKNSDNPCEEMDEIQKDLNKVGTELNNIIHALHPVDLERYGLVKSVENLCENFSILLGFHINFTSYDLTERFKYETELTLYRIVQEALKNIVQHAKASSATVDFYKRTYSVYLVITDNGIGFDKSKIGVDNFSKTGNGLVNIKYRTEILGGKFNIESSNNNGTEIHIEIPTVI